MTVSKVIVATGMFLLVSVSSPAQTQTSPHGNLSIACDQCHSAQSWTEISSPTKFNHATTRFPLAGQHQQVPCRQCHATLVFGDAKAACGECHTDVHRGELGADCTRCHSVQTWTVIDMPQRHARTRFPLVGRHFSTPCQACHLNQQKYEFVSVPTDCYGCHRLNYDATTSPAHRSAGFGTDCTPCHSVGAAQFSGTFDHAKTIFPLLGAHATVACSQCHAAGNFSAASPLCISCHQQAFATASNPKHTSFPTACTVCHTMNSWQPASYDHAKVGFPLTGVHATTDCIQCHINNVFPGTPTACVGCHLTNFNATTHPNHASSGIPTDCASCHTTSAWQPATFDHSKTIFPLTGAHLAVPLCSTCHVNNVYAGLSTACVSCHQKDLTGATAPPHTGFSNDCSTCHTTSAWQPASFNHSNTPFPLTGGHTTVACAQCHTNNVYAGLTHDCYTCHSAQFTGATSPVPHVGFPTTCATCHTTNPGWQPSTFTHANVSPRFPSDSRHSNAACNLCHQTPTDYTKYCCQSSGCHRTCAGGN